MRRKKLSLAWINFSDLTDKRKEKIMETILHPEVIKAIDENNLTPLQGLILNYLTDPEAEYTAKTIANACKHQLRQGSRRSVRRVEDEYGVLVDEILHIREEELKSSDSDEFDTSPQGGEIIYHGDLATQETIDIAEHKGGNGEDKDGIHEDEDGFWDVTEELDCVTACSKAPDKAVVYMSSVARKKTSLFMKWAGSQEWLAYLVGKWVSENEVEIVDLMLPNQNANSTLVSKVIAEEYNQVSVVGVMHSHHEMGGAKGETAGFSQHDEAFINSNHNVSLLVAKDGIAGHVRVKTPCGAFLRVTAKIRNMDEVTIDEKKLKEEFKEKIRFGHGRGSNHISWDLQDKKNPMNRRDGSYHF